MISLLICFIITIYRRFICLTGNAVVLSGKVSSGEVLSVVVEDFGSMVLLEVVSVFNGF
jgi:hypothetical protein